MKSFFFAPLLFVMALLFFFSAAHADTVSMKNGDVYHASVLKESFGEYVQILLLDGTEKHLLWGDISGIEKAAPAPTSIPETQHSEKPALIEAPHDHDRYASEMLNDVEGSRFELEFTALTYDSLWQHEVFHLSNVDVNDNLTSHEIRTLPEEIQARFYAGRWHFYLDLENQNAIEQSFSSIAIAYSVGKNVDLGLAVDFEYASEATSSLTVKGSDYVFGPFVRVVAPISERSTFEVSAAVGPSIEGITADENNVSVSANGVGLAAALNIRFSIYLAKKMSFLVGADGWLNVGTMSGSVLGSNSITPGSVDANFYRLRVMPVGLRISF